jgi:hypothetical protein
MDYGNSLLIGEAIGRPGLVLLLVMGGSLITPALYNSLVSIRDLLFSRHCFRHGLKNRITHSRLDRMLARKGVDLQYYLFSQPAADIEKQIGNCKHCDSYYLCDGYLENKEMDSKIDLPFCRNDDPILRIKNQQEKLYVLRSPGL